MSEQHGERVERDEKVKFLAEELLIPKHEADRLLANMEAQR